MTLSYRRSRRLRGPGLRHLPRLCRLVLARSKVTDESLTHVGNMKELHTLNLSHTGITDAGLARLHGLRKLMNLHLEGAPVTDAGVASLRQALPQVTVYRGDGK